MASQELLARHAQQLREVASGLPRGEQAERALADAMRSNLDHSQRSEAGGLQPQVLAAQSAERGSALERTASALHSAVAEAERFRHERAAWSQHAAELAQLREKVERLLADFGTQAADAQLRREQHAALLARCERADGEVAKLQSRQEHVRIELATARQQLAELKAANERLASRHERAEFELATARQRIAERQGTNERLVAQLADAGVAVALARDVARDAELDNARLLQRQQDVDDAAEWMQQRRSSVIALLEGAHSQVALDAEQLSRWLDDALRLMRASFGSARWRVGHLAIRAIEILTLRGRPRLARDHIEQIERSFRAWQVGRIDHRALAQHLLAQLGDSGPIGGAAAAPRESALRGNDGQDTVPRGLQVEPKLDPAARDVICFPVIDWHFRVQRPQHVARVLGARGHRVIYLCTRPDTGARENGFEVLESPAPNVWIVRLCITCKQAPNLYQQRLDGDVLAAYADALDAMREALGIVTPIAIVDLPFWRPLVEALPGAVLIYDCMDHHAGFSTNTDAMLSEEERLLHAADAIVVTSAWLASRLGAKRDVTLIRNGADVQRFAACPMLAPARSRPVIGYLGAISDWFDVGLVARAAKELPDADFVLVGDVTHPDVSAAQRLSNVRFVGEVPYNDAPMHVHGFDVCIIPFLITDLTLATNPVKAYEYLAAGKPVIATAMPELAGMDGMVGIAADHESFISLLRHAVAESGDAAATERRRAWARDHDWLQRGDAFESVILAQLPKASVVVLAWNNLEFTRACLESLEQATDYPDWELVLVDNASSDGTPEFFREYAASRPHVTLVLNDSNLGFAAGNNGGIRAASGDIIVLLNNDTYVTPGWLSGLVGHLRRHPELGIVGPVTNNIGNEAKIDVDYGDMRQMRIESRRWTREHPRGLTFCDVVAFFCCAMPRAVIDEVGMLDEEFGQGFFEDDDYCSRIRAIGRKVAIADDVFVHHHLSASFNTLRDERKRELFERNKAIYERKWGRWQPHAYRAGGR